MEERKQLNETAIKQPRHANEYISQINYDVRSLESLSQNLAESLEYTEASNPSKHSQQNKNDNLMFNGSKPEQRDWQQDSDYSNSNSQKSNNTIKKEIISPNFNNFEVLRNDRLSNYVPKEEDQNDVRTSNNPYITRSNESSFPTESNGDVNDTESHNQSIKEDQSDSESVGSKSVPLSESANTNQNRGHFRVIDSINGVVTDEYSDTHQTLSEVSKHHEIINIPKVLNQCQSIFQENENLKKQKSNLTLRLKRIENEHQEKIRELKHENHHLHKKAAFKDFIQNCYDTKEDDDLALLQFSIQQTLRYHDDKLLSKTLVS